MPWRRFWIRCRTLPDNGFIWHTTGAGKTLTSFKAAQLVSELDGVDKVMFVVDRHDLDTQTQSEYEAFEPGAVDSTDNTDELTKKLSSDSKIITLPFRNSMQPLRSNGTASVWMK